MAIIVINDIEYSSYATVENANEYFGAKFGSTWSEVAESDKKKLLVTATREIEKCKFQGYRIDDEQDLKFPRQIGCFVVEVDNEDLVQCCCEVANAIYTASLTNDNQLLVANAESIKSMSVGDTSISFQDNASIETDVFDAVAMPIIKKYLRCFLKGNVIVY